MGNASVHLKEHIKDNLIKYLIWSIGTFLLLLASGRVSVFLLTNYPSLQKIPINQYLTALLILIILLIFSVSLVFSFQIKLKKERKPKDKLISRYEYGYNEEVILFYKNPKLYPHLTPLEIATDIEARLYCQKCNSEIISENNKIKCDCTNISRAKGHIAEAKEFARGKLLDFLKRDISK